MIRILPEAISQVFLYISISGSWMTAEAAKYSNDSWSTNSLNEARLR